MKRPVNPLPLFAIAALALPGPAAAQAPPPIEIEADRATVNERQETATYTGDVVATRGALTIRSDVLTLYGTEGRLERAVAEGEPARCHRDPTPENPAIRCEAQRITYRMGEDRLHLEGEGRVEQGDNVFESATIVYDLTTETVRAGHDAQPNERVRATIYPQRKPEPATETP